MSKEILSHSFKKTFKSAFAVIDRFKSFSYAFFGIAFLLRSQPNAWLHALATVFVIVTGLFFGIGTQDWITLILPIVLVWFGEAVNTALEQVCNLVSPQYNIHVKHAKDVAAGAVLILALGAAIVGVLVFFPYVDAAIRH